MKYDYYRILNIIHRIPKNLKHSEFSDNVERYLGNKWVKGNFITNIDIVEEKYLSLQKAKKLTKEEAFMELL